jgi:hypothetical protein
MRAGKWEAYADGPQPAGGRRLAAVVIVLAVAGLLGWGLTHATAGCSCGPSVPFGRHQPGFHRLAGPPQRAVARLLVHVQLAPGLGPPSGVYAGGRRAALILYGAGSRYGVFRFTARRLDGGFDAGTVRALASACNVCTENRLVLLAPGVRGALLAGGNGPNSVTWIENGLNMMVLGPASSFDGARAVAAARALATANAR